MKYITAKVMAQFPRQAKEHITKISYGVRYAVRNTHYKLEENYLLFVTSRTYEVYTKFPFPKTNEGLLFS